MPFLRYKFRPSPPPPGQIPELFSGSVYNAGLDDRGEFTSKKSLFQPPQTGALPSFFDGKGHAPVLVDQVAKEVVPVIIPNEEQLFNGSNNSGRTTSATNAFLKNKAKSSPPLTSELPEFFSGSLFSSDLDKRVAITKQPDPTPTVPPEFFDGKGRELVSAIQLVKESIPVIIPNEGQLFNGSNNSGRVISATNAFLNKKYIGDDGYFFF